MSVLTNVPGMERELKAVIKGQHRATNGLVPHLGIGGWPTLILYRDRGVPDFIARHVLESLETQFIQKPFDVTSENGTYYSLDHHVLDDSAYKQCFFPQGHNPHRILMIGSRMKQTDSSLEKLTYKMYDESSFDPGFGEDVLGIHDIFGIKIITETRGAAESVSMVIESLPWIEVMKIEDKYAHPNLHPTVLDHPFGSLVPGYRAYHLDAMFNDEKYPELCGMNVEIQVVDEQQWKYNYWEHTNNLGMHVSYAHNRLARSAEHKGLLNGYNIYVVEGTTDVWKDSPEDYSITRVKPHLTEPLSDGKALLVRQQEYVDSYIHISKNGYTPVFLPDGHVMSEGVHALR